MLVWTQVGEIVFPVYTTVPISTDSSMTRNENVVAINPDDPVSKDPPAVAENGTSMPYEPEKRGIQRTSPTRDIYCPIHKTKNHDFSSCKVFLRTMKTTLPKVQQSGTSLKDTDKEQEATLTSDRFVGVIDIDPHEPSVLHLLEDYGSSSSSTPRDVFAIGGTNTSAQANAEAENQTVTPTQHLGTVNAILREAPYDPVLNNDLARWTERLRESVANLSNAFEEAATRAQPERPTAEDDALRRKNDKPKAGGEKKPAKDAPESRKKKSGKSGKRKAQAEVLASEYKRPPKHPDPQDSDLHVSHIFRGSIVYSSKREYKKVEREKIEFSDEDHRKAAIISGRYPIVVEPTIRNIKVALVLVDGGSSINLLFASTLDAMGIPRSELTPTDQPFHGITPQSSSKPLGKITLPVTFGQASNFRTKQITFHVAEFDTAYNAIIGRTALVKFMAASHYAYEVLKMPGPKGTITIQGNAKLAVQCDKQSLDMVEHMPSPPATTEPPKKVIKTTKTPKPDGAIKIVPLSSANPDKTVKIGASLNEK
uniref:Retrotransposon protein, putative, Ty3-gypsy subclass n=1 Tax=Oryza sativa subsp. japonica TaxID=39947 RepID=Q33BG2_ORYSJ|nr:retrotransposon protein, putative, Ty3-gypsy subclass [Oryza sativa Japonica Group]